MSINAITVFTKPWDKNLSLEALGKKMKALGVDGVELPVRPGYQVEPAGVGQGLAEAKKILADQGIKIGSVAGSVDEPTISAMGAAGIKILRICVGIDMKAGYLATERQLRQQWDALIPLLDRTGVSIGVQNHCDYCVGSAVGIMHLIEKYDPKHVSAVYDPAHCGLDGEPELMGLDIVWSHLSLVNLKSAFWQRANGPDEPEADYKVVWSTCHHALYSWSALVNALKERGYAGDICLPAEYTGPKGMAMGDDCLRYLKEDIAYLKQLQGSAPAASEIKGTDWQKGIPR
jgi:sugar phosphate isomerase/epimerase